MVILLFIDIGILFEFVFFTQEVGHTIYGGSGHRDHDETIPREKEDFLE